MSNPKSIPPGYWKELVGDFPRLAGRYDDCQLIGLANRYYNCIAWALGIEDRWVNPPTTEQQFVELLSRPYFNLESCSEELASVDGYARNGECTHASRKLVSNEWSSKLGEELKITHPRDGLIGDTYGNIVVHFKTKTGKPAPTTVGSSGGPPAPLSDSEFQDIQKVADLLASEFPNLVMNFNGRYYEWTEQCQSTPRASHVCSSSAFASGPQWDALVQMDTKILPLVVAKLRSDDACVFGCELYNQVQTNDETKVTPDQIEHFWVLNWQAKLIIKLYHSQLKEFDQHVARWENDMTASKFSSNSDSKVSGPGYESLKTMGQPTVPLIMARYSQNQDDWWYELLSEIVNGCRSGLRITRKRNLYQVWMKWFQDPDLGGPKIETYGDGPSVAIMQNILTGDEVTISLAT